MEKVISLPFYSCAVLKKLLLFLVILVLLGLGGIALFIAGVHQGVFGALANEEELRDIRNETASLVFAEQGELIGKYFAENRTNTSYEELPAHLVNALIATEDARYFEHEGVDYRSLMRVFFKSLLLGDRSSGGGSTLSQQLAKNLFGREYHGPLSLPVNKVKEAILAGRLEAIYSKEELLSLYFNTVPFGENVYGVEAAAGRFFNAKAGELKVEQSAVLVGMLKANTYYNPRLYPENAIQRRNVVLGQMEKYGYLSGAQSDSLQSTPLELDYSRISTEGPAQYFLVQVKKEAQKLLDKIAENSGVSYDIEKDGLRIHTTLNRDLQLMALDAFQNHLGKMQPLLRQHYRTGARANQLREMAQTAIEKAKISPGSEPAKSRELFAWAGFYTDSVTAIDSAMHSLLLLHAGLVAMDPQDGAVKTWVGGIDFNYFPYDQVTAKRQLASAFKPVLYTAALESGVEPCTYLSNDTVVFEDFDDWTPRNYDHTYGGKYSLPGALAKSVNVPTVDLLYHFERDRLDSLWKALGFSSELPDGPSVALGTVSASALQLCRAYAVLANGGYKVTPRFIESITTESGALLYEYETPQQRESIVSARSALFMQQMMQKVVNEGTATSLRSRFGIQRVLAGKTGTSQDYADAWFGAYTPGLVMVSRVGAASPQIHFNSGRHGSGSTLALPLVGLTMAGVQGDDALRQNYFQPFPELPSSLAEALECPDYRETNPMEDFFDLFRSQRTDTEKEQRTAERRQRRQDRQEEPEQEEKDGLLQKLFRKLKNE